jgi:uncharacterized integral membrane protein
MSNETASTTAPGDRTEAGEWFAIGGFVLLVALLLAGTGWSRAEDEALVALLALGGVAAICGLGCLMVGAVVTGTTIALRAEHARLEQERSAQQAD